MEGIEPKDCYKRTVVLKERAQVLNFQSPLPNLQHTADTQDNLAKTSLVLRNPKILVKPGRTLEESVFKPPHYAVEQIETHRTEGVPLSEVYGHSS